MGLISFLKEKGAKLFGKKEVEVTKEVALTKVQKLEAEIQRLGLNVNDLRLELCEQVIVNGTTPTTADAERVALALGNIDGIGSVDNQLHVLNPAPEAVFYTVQEGDSLSKISKAQYGDPMRYEAIFEANKPMLSHPDKIYPGQVLRIPQ
ncbi:peptidoglycan-binding protein LysM [Neolewinella aurantiaca]|uniref:Potassium binding protein Kbp n=1 Tax=Neolewinella aurantiaca TaxID=2602767 RepID=A0A5C7FHS5_9BACT|nr:peptidoglycan-binding protein LysM [Neolewinella aurantiaca]TXF85689.1 peptidoglycan-binding protein LysM [Neolewinella aurantiaca]